MPSDEATERFVQLIAENQNRLFAYVFSLLGDRNAAHDVVQETNLVLWRKKDDFEIDRPFLPWAFAITRFQVLSRIRDQKRDRLLLDEELASSMAKDIEDSTCDVEMVRDALRGCLSQLTQNNRTLIDWHYYRQMPIADMAGQLRRSIGAIKVALLRTRRQLGECIEKGMNAS